MRQLRSIVMPLARSSRIIRPLLAAAAFGLCIGLATPAAAQFPPDVQAVAKKYDELFRAGNYAGALGEAQKFEALIRSRYGVQHQVYAMALLSIGRSYLGLGRYDEGEA